MRCSHCHSGRMKRAENFGAERMQCGSCGIVTKRAETRLTEKQQEFINYVSMWPTERIENAWEVTQDLDQNGISMAIGISRSNVPRVVASLVTAGLVRKKKAYILDENNRVKSVKKLVYYLTPEGRKHVTESRRAETFEAEEPFICPECRRASTKSKTSQVCVRCESEYQSGLNPPMRVPWPGDDGYYAETFEAELPILGEPIVWERPLTSFLDSVISKGHYDGQKSGTVLGEFVAINDHPNGYYQKGDTALITIYEEPADRNYDLNDKYIGPVFYKIQISTSSIPPTMTQHGLMAYPADVEQNWKRINSETFESDGLLFPFKLISNLFSGSSGEDLYLMQMEMLEEDEIEPYRNPVVMKSAGYRLWQACFLACLDEGLSPIKAEELCNSKFIRKSDPAMMIPSLKEAMRPLIKQYLSYTDREGKSYREAYFEAHEGGHIDEVAHQHSFEAPNRYPVRPTRPSEDWPRPTPRPRRPNRRPNPRPRPARRPF